MAGKRSFRGELKHDSGGLGWVVVHLPFIPRAVWPTMVRSRVQGEISGPGGSLAFRSSLFYGTGAEPAFLLVNRAMQAATALQPGDQAALWLAPDLAPRPAELPEELDALLDEAEGLRAWYGELGEYMQREVGRWIAAVQTGEARLRRAQSAAERMLNTMEAEVELPPLLQQAFRARPAAVAGWAALSPSQRRRELFAVFGYQSQTSRQKRAAKLVEAAHQRGTASHERHQRSSGEGGGSTRAKALASGRKRVAKDLDGGPPRA